MKIRMLHLVLVFFIGLQTINAQTYYEHYQDGLVIFQLKTDQKKILSNNNIVDFKKEPLFTDYLKDFDIVEVQHLHPDIDDELLNRTYQIRLSDITLVDKVVRELNKNGTIAYAELKELHRSFFTPNDQYYASNQWALPKIQAPDAWDISLGSSSVVVAVTDDAFELTHSDLQGVLLPGHDAGGGSSPSPCGSNSGDHGTHVAGIVGAKTNNGIGVASIGAGVSILPVKIGDCSSGALPYGYQGVVWAANNGADVINMSWGGPSGGSYGQNVINNAWNQGVILVAAAGNDGTTSQLYPAAYNNVIAVASTQSNDTKSSFSQYGTWIDVAAPGSQILSTVPGNTYQNMSGTSMASPMVAGLLGLMKSYAPSASKTDLVDCLLNTADAMPGSSHYNNNQLGSGRINAYKALSCLMSFQNDYDAAISEIISPVGSNCSSQIIPQIELRNFGAQTLTSATITYNWGAAPQTYSWTGNLPAGQSVSVTLPTHTLTSGNYTFTATVSNPNGQTDQNSANNTSTSNFSIVANGETVTLTLNTDCWGEETTWEIKDASNNVVYSGGPYQNGVNGTQNTHEICLSEGCYTFIISDSYGDGMAGAQYQGCNVNGYYKLVDGTGDLLFEIGSVNFGSSTSHQFCLSQTQIDDDAGITAIIAPQFMVCSPSVTPIVELKNFGANTLTSVDILYSIGGTNQTFNWTGSLASQQTTNVTLPAIVSPAGAQTFSAETNNPNGQTDQNQANDDESRSILANFTAQQLPFIEDFENNAQGWFISNPDNSITWELAQVGGITPGNIAAKMDFFNYQEVNRRDGLISPKISLQGVSSAEMTFDHAYRRAQQSANDSLIIYVSTDCTASWTRVAGWAEDGSGTFATQTTSTAEFTPANAVDWCFQPISQQTPGASCFTVNLDAFVGNDIFVMFEAYNAGNNGNNLFIDNINITGIATGNTPEPDFTTDVNQICVGDVVQFTDASTENPTSWNWTFPGGTPATSTSQNPSVTYNSSGTYNVILEVTNQYGTQTQTFTNEVTVVSAPTVTATASETSICAGESVTLTAGGASSYTWDNGLGSGSTKTVSPTITTTYQVNGTSGNCSGSASVTVNVNPSPATPVIVQNGNVLSVNIQAGETAVWLLEGNVVGSGSSITITSDGNYEVRVTNADGCSSSTSSYFTVESSSIGENNFGDQFNVYPNPTENIVTISWSGANRVKGVQLYDAQGRIIQNQIVYDEEGIELDLTRYQTGVYIVRLETENGVYSKKVTKR